MATTKITIEGKDLEIRQELQPGQAAAKGTPVLITTKHKGVFFGYAEDTSGNTIVLERGRLCVYWSRDMKGFMGLATIGPSEGCRIGPPAKIEVRDVTCVVQVDPAAVAKWEAAPWAR